MRCRISLFLAEPKLVDEEIMQIIREAADLAPLHNPANLQGIIAASAVFTGSPQVLKHTGKGACMRTSALQLLKVAAMMRYSMDIWEILSDPEKEFCSLVAQASFMPVLCRVHDLHSAIKSAAKGIQS